MSRFLRPFIRGIQGIPYGERVMPGYIFANKDQRGTSNVEYKAVLRGERWWYERTVTVTRPNATDEVHTQWFGGYDSEEQCQDRIAKAEEADKIFSEL